ncbi:ferredoxin [Streptomyces hygroscopicus]|uniref:ferredoxin n=1 Tax=Streptomyces hygroscopicus TaxID=1912 RepID=UPI00364063FE
MRVTVDQPRCVASGQCVFAAPDIFDQDDEGTAVVLEAAPKPRPPCRRRGGRYPLPGRRHPAGIEGGAVPPRPACRGTGSRPQADPAPFAPGAAPARTPGPAPGTGAGSTRTGGATRMSCRFPGRLRFRGFGR